MEHSSQLESANQDEDVVTPDEKKLHKLLVEIAGADNKGLVSAQVQLREALADYRSSSRVGIADIRKQIVNLKKKLNAARASATALHLATQSLFRNAYGHPVYKLLNELDTATRAVEKALHVAKARPNRKERMEPRVLAYEVAAVMQDYLGIEPTATRDTAENINHRRGGARYARLLRGVLDIAGFDVRSIPRKSKGLGKKDIGPLIDLGLRLLKNPSLPR